MSINFYIFTFNIRNSEYDQEIPPSQIAENPRNREEEPDMKLYIYFTVAVVMIVV